MAERGLFGGVSGRGDVDTGDQAWLAAMLDTEAALARALERAGLAPAGAGAAIAAEVSAAADAASRLAAAHRDTVMIGRTLLQQAVPVTFGLVAAGWLTGLDEARANLDRVRAGRLAVQFGGAAGTLSSLGADGPRVAALLAGELGLPLPVLPWHTDRLRIVEVAASCACAAAALGKIARDMTLLAQSEVAEVREVREGD